MERQRKYRRHTSYHIKVLIAVSTNMMATVSISYIYQHVQTFACMRMRMLAIFLPYCGN